MERTIGKILFNSRHSPIKQNTRAFRPEFESLQMDERRYSIDPSANHIRNIISEIYANDIPPSLAKEMIDLPLIIQKKKASTKRHYTEFKDYISAQRPTLYQLRPSVVKEAIHECLLDSYSLKGSSPSYMQPGKLIRFKKTPEFNLVESRPMSKGCIDDARVTTVINLLRQNAFPKPPSAVPEEPPTEEKQKPFELQIQRATIQQKKKPPKTLIQQKTKAGDLSNINFETSKTAESCITAGLNNTKVAKLKKLRDDSYIANIFKKKTIPNPNSEPCEIRSTKLQRRGNLRTTFHLCKVQPSMNIETDNSNNLTKGYDCADNKINSSLLPDETPAPQMTPDPNLNEDKNILLPDPSLLMNSEKIPALPTKIVEPPTTIQQAILPDKILHSEHRQEIVRERLQKKAESLTLPLIEDKSQHKDEQQPLTLPLLDEKVNHKGHHVVITATGAPRKKNSEKRLKKHSTSKRKSLSRAAVRKKPKDESPIGIERLKQKSKPVFLPRDYDYAVRISYIIFNAKLVHDHVWKQFEYNTSCI